MAFNELTAAQAERLALLAEECGECVQAIGKILRHGYESCHPNATNHEFDNRYELQKELGDVVAAMKLLIDAGDLDEEQIIERSQDKLETVVKYLHHAKVKP